MKTTEALTASERQRFHANVDKCGPLPDTSNAHYKGLGQCWSWTGCLSSKGYGVITLAGQKQRYAHRLAYALQFGEFEKKRFVCHKCDNPSCVNPEHLFLGDARANMLDKTKKKRNNHALGESYKSAKITESDLKRIIELCASGMSQRAVGSLYGISNQHISRLVTRKRWKHVTIK